MNIQQLSSELQDSKFYIFSEKKIGKKYEFQQKVFTYPDGIHFSCGNDWLKWCLNEKMFYQKYKYVYEIEFDAKQCLILKNWNQLKTFHNKYATQKGDYVFIDWNAVSLKYGGIVFLPYLKIDYNKYPDFLCWYSSIEASTGYIWQKDCLKSINQIYTKKNRKWVIIDQCMN